MNMVDFHNLKLDNDQANYFLIEYQNYYLN